MLDSYQSFKSEEEYQMQQLMTMFGKQGHKRGGGEGGNGFYGSGGGNNFFGGGAGGGAGPNIGM